MAKQWRLPSHDTSRIVQLEKSAGVPPVVAQLLWNRGIFRSEEVHTFLDAKLLDLRDPELLPGASEAAERLQAAIAAKRRITIYGDYDADGMTGTAILINCLRLLGADANYHVPNRLEEGYGLSCDSLRTLAARGSQVVVSVDCGICSITEAETALELGLELIITDHHEMREELPRASVLVHPRLPGSSYPFGGLCGAGVALKVAWALCKRMEGGGARLSERLRNFLLSAVGLAALGTVADIVPLLDENRVLVKYGLWSLQEHPPLGVEQLIKITQLEKRPQLSSEDIAFTLAPRLNAAGRLGQAALGVELLTTENPERAQALAEYIHELNKSRDSLERSIYLAAAKQAKEEFDPENDPALVLSGRGWHVGVIGIVAGRLAEKFNRPVVLIAVDPLGVKPAVGSGRTAGRFNLHAGLTACSARLLGHGGHAAAVGLKMEEGAIEAFRHEFVEYAAGEFLPSDREASVKIDAEVPLSQLTLETVQQIERLSPFGQGNPRPTLCTTNVTLSEPPKYLGAGERHIAVRLNHCGTRMRGVAFGAGEWLPELTQHTGPIDIAYRPVINHYKGRNSVEVHLVDWRATESSGTPTRAVGMAPTA